MDKPLGASDACRERRFLPVAGSRLSGGRQRCRRGRGLRAAFPEQVAGAISDHPEAAPQPGRGWTPPWTPPTESRARSRPAPWPHPVTAWRAASPRGFSLLQRGLALGAGAGRSESPRALQTRLLLGLRGQRGWGLPSHRKLSSRSRVASWRRRRRLASRSWVYLRMRVSPFFLFKK